MGELGTALIAAGAALMGGTITGWFAHRAGRQQAAAARHAGDRQADALLESVRIQAEATLAAVRLQLDDGRDAQAYMQRRRCYGQFIEAVDAWGADIASPGTAGGDRREAERAFGAVAFEGPAEVTERAREIMRFLRSGSSDFTRFDDAKAQFMEAAHRSLESRGASN
ncbi:hypothetical protein LO772_10485 [Yinghuangia sp. ASG 101]|uniref:hypothetical protein n=1 Tax=Yinghuangia sp. ASG 101 TaxID=2896848 RepID=UPI001E2B7B4C|nr:hypothetical protein [Yinghuangia sp. ASG 101]UGQ13984.1 hypothetical protein LO772_10485 [Yinghuangia sp. ASG 101]